MKLPRDVSGRQLAAALRALGYVVTRQRGSHIRLTTQRDGEHHEVVPDHHPAKHHFRRQEIEPKFKALAESLADSGVEFTFRFDDKLHERALRTDTGWHIQLGRGLDIYQKPDS